MKNILLLHPISPVVNGSPPLSLAYIGAVLEKKGCRVKIIDAAAPYARYTINDIVEEARQFKPDMIGMTISTTFAKLAYQLTRMLANNVQALIVAGGPHPTLLPEESLQESVDIVIRGEGEDRISEIVDFLDGKIKLEDICGISYRNGKKEIIHNPSRATTRILNETLLPAKHLFKESDYVKSNYEFIRYGNIITSRGCPYKCIFCSSKILGEKFRYRSPENVLEEINSLRERYNINTFFILDDVFTYDRERVIALCRVFKDLPAPIRWTCITRVNLVDAELLDEMKKAGCYSITYGIESGDPETLRLIKKGIQLEELENCIKYTSRLNIRPHTSFMFGFPWETPSHIKTSRLLLKKILSNLTYIVNGGIPIPYPGTELYEANKAKYNIGQWWLKIDLKWWAYRKISDRPSMPIFEKLFFKDFYILKMNFFNYPRDVITEIRKIVNLIGVFNIWMYSKRLSENAVSCYCYKNILLKMVRLSRFVHRINPTAEEKLFNFTRYLIRTNIRRILIER